MVGVPGKYKGCETCRRRRVKCSNERPFCQKCITSGRQCEGYERERVFITGTPENKGRVASHPRKTASSTSSARKQRLKASAGSASEQTTPERTPEREPYGKRSYQGLAPTPPLASAWDDYITLRRSQGTDCYALVTALQTPLQGVSTDGGDLNDGDGFKISLAPYTPPELSMMTGSNFSHTSGRCLVHLSSADGGGQTSESFCVFLFENTVETPPNSNLSQLPVCSVQRMGPRNFTAFPNHHFFARVYRPMAISAALLNRQSTFLAEADWTTTPWVRHPKSLLDYLLDISACLPALLERADRITLLDPTLSRRHEAEQILHGCLALESRFGEWQQLASHQASAEQPPCYWAEETTDPGGSLPFSHTYSFRDGVTGIMFLHYWMAEIPLHRCIDGLYGIIFQPVIDSYPDMWPDLPPSLQLDDPGRYTQTRELAASVCRGLDAALAATAQPDVLAAPMTVALDLYRDLNATSQDGLLEILWLEAFRSRLVEKGQHVATVLQKKNWFEIARY